MKCNKLVELSNLIDLNNLNALTTIYVYISEKCIGRVALSKILGVGEREARSVINYLKNTNILTGREETCINIELIDKYGLKINTVEIGRYNLSLIKIEDRDLINYIMKHIVKLRDHLVIRTQNPYSIEIIGFYNGFKHVIPGLPNYLYDQYLEILVKQRMSKNTLFILWNQYRKYYCEAYVTNSLYNICLDILRK
uniref:Uncharacterized protein n=2 Tax=Staphylothermus marinus TaxID=2280 RepID=A0A7C4D7K8_STAMA